MTKAKFPLQLASVPRIKKSDAQDLAFGREELASAIRFLDHPDLAEIAARLRAALAALPPATVLPLGCWRCNGDVPLCRSDLVSDRICPGCADDYDRALSERRERMRAARQAA